MSARAETWGGISGARARRFGFSGALRSALARAERNLLIEAAEWAPRCGSVLELACGSGGLLEALVEARPDLRLMGVEEDEVKLQRALRRCNAGAIEVLQGTPMRLPVADRSQDVVLGCLALHGSFASDKRRVLQEVRRVLRPRGRFYLVELCPPATAMGRGLAGVYRFLEPAVVSELEGELSRLAWAQGASVELLRCDYGLLGTYRLRFAPSHR